MYNASWIITHKEDIKQAFFQVFITKYKIPMMAILIAIFLIVIILKFWKLFKKEKKKSKYLSSGINEINQMTGEEFEYFLQAYFQKLGYKADVTPKSNDYGADLILQKRDIKTVVQAKRYTGKVGVKAVQEIVGAKGYYSADKAIVATCSYFTSNAIKLANQCEVELWDRTKLIAIMEKVQGKKIVDVVKTEVEYIKLKRTCPLCKGDLILIKGKKGNFYGCKNYPSCTYTK